MVPHLLALMVLVPTGVDATCSAGEGRIIDFALVSQNLYPYLTLEGDLSVPWRSHVGLKLSLSTRLRSLHAPALRVPRPLPLLPISAEGKHQADDAMWNRAIGAALDFITSRSRGTMLIGADAAAVAVCCRWLLFVAIAVHCCASGCQGSCFFIHAWRFVRTASERRYSNKIKVH